jgi:hypothetical protein
MLQRTNQLSVALDFLSEHADAKGVVCKDVQEQETMSVANEG